MKLQCDNEKKCLEFVRRFLDGDLSAEEKQKVSENVVNCRPCKDFHELELKLKQLIKKNCSDKCPEQVLNQIKSKLFIVIIILIWWFK